MITWPGAALAGAANACIAIRARLCAPRPKRFHGVGDVAPDSLVNRPADAGPIGAFVSVDPVTNRITAIRFN